MKTSTVRDVPTLPATANGMAHESASGSPAKVRFRERIGRRYLQALVRRLFSPETRAGIYLGVGLMAAGIAVLAYTWSRVAGLALVARQLPYLASGGFAGLVMVMLGGLVVHLDAKRRLASRREERLDQLSATLEAVASAIRDRRESNEE